MSRYVFASVRMALVTLVVLGIAYPLLVTGLSQVAFPVQANGSLVTTPAGTVVGSELIGQLFTDARYFRGRPSAAGAAGYDAAASGASNLGPTSKALVDRVGGDVAAAGVREGLEPGSVPIDMVTSSGSGLDPDITLASAYAQVDRVARVRGMSRERVRGIVDEHMTARQFRVLGEPRVNVLRLNLALDAAK